ncbi:MAG TPA: hypothetical protein PKW35_03185, partial [Nannocystaceae bacterium]|nr:hypothetical protein [Nannocystaceae bacterium]
WRRSERHNLGVHFFGAIPHLDWFVSTLRDFGKVWTSMTPENQGRLLRAIVAKVVVDDEQGKCRVELVNFDAIEGAKEAA